MSNILLTDAIGDDSYSIEATNYPLPNTIKNKVSSLAHFLVDTRTLLDLIQGRLWERNFLNAK